MKLSGTLRDYLISRGDSHLQRRPLLQVASRWRRCGIAGYAYSLIPAVFLGHLRDWSAAIRERYGKRAPNAGCTGHAIPAEPPQVTEQRLAKDQLSATGPSIPAPPDPHSCIEPLLLDSAASPAINKPLKAELDGRHASLPVAEALHVPRPVTQTCDDLPLEATLSLTKRESTFSLTKRLIRHAGIPLGVTAGWLARQSEDLSLSPDDLENLIAIRRDYRASFPSMAKALRHGISPLELYQLYSVRAEAASLLYGPVFSLKWIYKFTKAFPEADLSDDNLAELLASVRQQVAARVPRMWRYPDDALRVLIKVSETHGTCFVESCLDILGSLPEENEAAACGVNNESPGYYWDRPPRD